MILVASMSMAPDTSPARSYFSCATQAAKRLVKEARRRWASGELPGCADDCTAIVVYLAAAEEGHSNGAGVFGGMLEKSSRALRQGIKFVTGAGRGG